MSKKYEFTGEVNTQGLKRIRALIDIDRFGVKQGDLGGFIAEETNLDHVGDCWVSDNARISGNARISDNACISGNARIWDNACISGNARIWGDACILGDACICRTSDYLVITSVGSERGILTAFKTQQETTIRVTRGCFQGSLEAFEAAVTAKHGDNKYGKQYALAIALIKQTLNEEN